MRLVALRVLVLLVSVALVSGCGAIRNLFGKSKNAEPDEPAALVVLESPITIKQMWSQSLGQGEGNLWNRQAPAVAEGRVYATDLKGRVSAFDAESGKQLWRVDTELSLSGGPGVGAGRVVLGGLEGDVVALDADSGAEIWRAKVSSEVIAAPLVAQGFAVVRSNDGRVFGFSLGDGKRSWVFDRGLPPLTIRGNATPVQAHDGVVVGYEDGMVVTLRIADGTPVWEQAVAPPDGRNELERLADVDGDIQVGLSEVFAQSAKGQVMAIDLATGRPLWNRDIRGYTGLALLGDKVVAADSSGVLMALDRATGAGMWRQDALINRWVTTPAAVSGTYVVVGDIEGYLHWFDAATGAAVGRVHVAGDPIRATPQVSADGVVYAVTTDGKLAAFRVAGP